MSPLPGYHKWLRTDENSLIACIYGPPQSQCLYYVCWLQREERIRQLHKRLHQKSQVTVARQSHTDHIDSVTSNSRLKDITPRGARLAITTTAPSNVIEDSKSCIDNANDRTLLSPLNSAKKNKCFKEFLSVDSDSALVPTSLTVRCSPISENYSESYCWQTCWQTWM